MEEEQKTLLNSLRSFGVSIPNGAASLKDLMSPAAMYSICVQCLSLVGDSSSFPTCLPDSTSEKFKVCTDVSASIRSMGFVGDLSFYEFLHPSEDDTYMLMRFLVEKLSDSSAVGKAADSKQSFGEDFSNSKSEQKLSLKSYVSESSPTDPKDSDDQSIEKAQDIAPPNLMRYETQDCWKDGSEIVTRANGCTVESDKGQALTSAIMTNPFEEQYSKMRYAIEELQHRRKGLEEEVKDRTSELQDLDDELELFKAAAEMAFNEDHSSDFYIETLNGNIDLKKKSLIELELQWDGLRTTLEEKKRSLEESIYGSKPDLYEKFRNLEAVEGEINSILFETRNREEERSGLSAELEKQQPQESRRSYIERIKEITKNSRKQEADIERILRDTRELQLESNSIQERLHRTYAVTDETVYREAKKDLVGRQAYKLLTSIHETFEQICEKILASDRVRREMAEHEKKLTRISSRSSDIAKLQTNLEVVSKENEKLDQSLILNEG